MIDDWMGTLHAKAHPSTPANSHYGYSCMRCHTTGWDTSVKNNGADEFTDSLAGNKWAYSDTTKFEYVNQVQCEACHGPVGTAQGTFDPAHFNRTPDYSAELCGKCHNGSHHGFYDEWKLSGHAVSLPATWTREKNGQCMRCHTAQDFIAYLDDPNYDAATFVPTGTLQPIACVTCHDPHQANNGNVAQLRVPLGDSTRVICDVCHNAEIETSVNIYSTPHHATSEALTGASTFGYQYPDQKYSNSPHTTVAKERCVDCHVNSTGTDNLGFGVHGHTFMPRTAACANPDCHGEDYYNHVDTTGQDPDKMFDYRGVQTTTKTLIATLQAQLALINPALKPDTSLGLAYNEALYNLNAANAEGSFGIHNTKLVQKLLIDALAKFLPTDVQVESNVIPNTYSISQNYPNPFNPTTTIKFSLPEATNVKVVIYDILGKQVETLVNSYMSAGSYNVTWNAGNYASGVYLYRIETKSFSAIKKMLLVK